MVSILTIPPPTQRAATYNQIFLAIVPDSKQPMADLQSLGLPADLVRYSGTGAWSAGTAFGELESSGLIGVQVTPATIMRFYLTHPLRIWRRAKAALPVAFALRPAYGNFERSAGHPPGATSRSFSLWTDIHERYFTRCSKAILIALLVSPILIAAAWARLPAQRGVSQAEPDAATVGILYQPGDLGGGPAHLAAWDWEPVDELDWVDVG